MSATFCLVGGSNDPVRLHDARRAPPLTTVTESRSRRYQMRAIREETNVRATPQHASQPANRIATGLWRTERRNHVIMGMRRTRVSLNTCSDAHRAKSDSSRQRCPEASTFGFCHVLSAMPQASSIDRRGHRVGRASKAPSPHGRPRPAAAESCAASGVARRPDVLPCLRARSASNAVTLLPTSLRLRAFLPQA